MIAAWRLWSMPREETRGIELTGGRLMPSSGPSPVGSSLTGNQQTVLSHITVGDYRVSLRIGDNALRALVVRVARRDNVYR